MSERRLTDEELENLKRAAINAQLPPYFADVLDLIAEVQERRVADLSDHERELCSKGLGIWESDYNDAPFDEIHALRWKLQTRVR